MRRGTQGTRSGPHTLLAAAALLGALAMLAAPAAAPAASPYKVTTRADHAPGACSPADCTLREAVLASNPTGSADTIKLPSSKKPYRLKQDGFDETAAAGDLDVLAGQTLTVVGTKDRSAVVDAGPVNDRVFHGGVGSSLTLKRVTLQKGAAVNGGAGVRTAGHLVLANAVVRRNENFGDAGFPGGGVYVAGSMASLLMRKTSVTRNDSADGGGGGVAVVAADPSRIETSFIYGNDATGPGGGIFLEDVGGQVVIENSTIYANSSTDTGAAGGAGGLHLSTGVDGILQNVTMAVNSTARAGMGATVYNGSGTQALDPRNTIFNSPSGGPNCAGTGVPPLNSSGYNIDSGTSCGLDGPGNDQESTAALLQPPANNGGPTRTSAIPGNSPAKNVSHCDLEADQRGVTRPQGPGCEIGAFEREQ